MRVGTSITNSDTPRAIGGEMAWLFWIVEAAFVFASLAFALIAAFLAPAHHETFATLASLRQTDFAMAVGLATISLVAALGSEMLRRKLRPRTPAPSHRLLHRLARPQRDQRRGDN